MKQKKPFSLLLIIFAIALFLSYHVYNMCIMEINNQKADNLIKEEMITNSQEKVEKINENEEKKNYLGILSIPKINFKKEFYSINNKKNNVNKNIEILKGSTMPNIKGSTLTIAAHSGNSYIGYFKNLYKLSINDKIYIYYNNYKYQYIIANIYEVNKNGTISFNKNINENYLVLTTCSKNSDKQLIVISKLLKE